MLESLFNTAKGLQAIRLVTLLKGNPSVLEPAVCRCSLKKVFLNNWQNSQQYTCVRTAAFLEKDSCEVCEFLRTPYFTEHLRWLLVTVSGFHPATLLEKRFPQRCFSVNFAKFLRTSFHRALPDDCLLSLFANFEKFFRTSLLYSSSEKLFISCTSCSISTSRYSEQLFHRCHSSIQEREVAIRRPSCT